MTGSTGKQDFAATVSIHPGLSRARQMIGEGKLEQAAQHLIGFLRTDPANAQAHAMLGETANLLGALGQAEQFLRKAIALGATDFEVRRNLASVLNQQERPGLAIPLFEALVDQREDINLRGALAAMYEKIGQSDRALDTYRLLTEQKPGNPQVWIAYGHCLRSNGRVDEAVACYRRAIAIDDGYGEAWWGLASIKARIFDGRDIETMREALRIAVDERNQSPLHFALARALHDHADFAEAFRHYEAGNRIRALSLKYDAAELSTEIDELERQVDEAYMARLPDAPVGEAVPIFIISLPRSGSTLLEQMLGSHSQIEAAGELPYIPAILRGFMEMATRRGKLTVPQAITMLSDEQAATFGKEYLARAAIHRTADTDYFIDKLPHNWSNLLFIRKILPQARFIDIRRPAMDCCFSNFTQSFTSAHPASFTLEDVGRSYVDNVRLMSHFDRVAPGLVQHVDYRALVDDPRSQLDPVMRYLGLEWEDVLLEFHRLDRVVRTPSSEQVRRPLNRDGMEVWRPYSEWLGPLRAALGELSGG